MTPRPNRHEIHVITVSLLKVMYALLVHVNKHAKDAMFTLQWNYGEIESFGTNLRNWPLDSIHLAPVLVFKKATLKKDKE